MVPPEVHEAAIARAKARAVRDFNKADALHKTIVDAGYRFLVHVSQTLFMQTFEMITQFQYDCVQYRVITGSNGEETLARKYRIRLRYIRLHLVMYLFLSMVFNLKRSSTGESMRLRVRCHTGRRRKRSL